MYISDFRAKKGQTQQAQKKVNQFTALQQQSYTTCFVLEKLRHLKTESKDFKLPTLYKRHVM